jgi:DNA-binding XRE family transcriptional regulator
MNMYLKRLPYSYGRDYYFGGNLKMLRLMHHVSQNKLSRIIGVKRSTYVNYEDGRSFAPSWFIIKASDYFNVTTDELLKQRMDDREPTQSELPLTAVV